MISVRWHPVGYLLLAVLLTTVLACITQSGFNLAAIAALTGGVAAGDIVATVWFDLTHFSLTYAPIALVNLLAAAVLLHFFPLLRCYWPAAGLAALLLFVVLQALYTYAPPMQAVFGMHNWPGAPVGTFAVSAGPVMASSNEFKITVRGKGSHAALPHNGIDPVPIACQMVQGFQTIITRNKKPVDAGVISVTMIHAGEATNVVPDSCELQGTVRTFSIEVLDLIEKRMKQVAESICTAFDAQCEFEFHRNYPPTINSPAEAEFARQVMGGIVGAEQVMHQEPTMGAEDFSYMLQAKPGAYVFISNGDGAHREMGHGGGPCTLHNPSYDFNDDLIPLGGTYWVELATQWLAQPTQTV